jgi:hypothetical protein
MYGAAIINPALPAILRDDFTGLAMNLSPASSIRVVAALLTDLRDESARLSTDAPRPLNRGGPFRALADALDAALAAALPACRS